MPRGLRALTTWSVAYGAQVHAYLFLLTDRYPYSGPPDVEVPCAES
jgi:hypothetical protein